MTGGPWCFECSNVIIGVNDDWKLWNVAIELLVPLGECENHWRWDKFNTLPTKSPALTGAFCFFNHPNKPTLAFNNWH